MDDDDFTVVPGAGTQKPTDTGGGGISAGDIASGVAGALGAAAAALVALRMGAKLGAEQIIALAGKEGKVTIQVRSAAIAQLAYAIESGDLEVTFHDGSVYYWPQVSIVDFTAFVNAPSKGVHFNRHFRGKENLIQGKKKGWKMPLG